MSATTVVLSTSNFGTKVEYHSKRKQLVSQGYSIVSSTKSTVTLVKEAPAPAPAPAPVASRRSSTPSRRRSSSRAPAPSRTKRSQPQSTERTFTLEQIKDALAVTIGNTGKRYTDIKDDFNDGMTLDQINEKLPKNVNKDTFERRLNDIISSPKRRRSDKQRQSGGDQTARTIQQETYQDPLTYAIVAIGAFAAMMIGLQK